MYYKNLSSINTVFAKSICSEPIISLSQWADRYRVLSPKSASTPGQWSTQKTPYLTEIMDSLSTTSNVERIVFMKGTQLGGTEVGNNWIGYVIHHMPGPMLVVSPTIEMAKRNSKQRVEPLIDNVPELRALVPPARSRDSGNTILCKEFPNGILMMTGANSAVGLRAMPTKYLFLDEVDSYPGDANGEGDPVMLAERRTANFSGSCKIFLVSTPTLKGISRIQREFDRSDQRYYKVPCPHCKKAQVLKFKQLKWRKEKPETIKYHCLYCKKPIDEYHKTQMLKNGYWEATANSPTRGYHLSALYSPLGWLSWTKVARLYEQAKDNNEAMKSFINTVLGEPFEDEHEAPEWIHLYERREPYPMGIVPQGGLFLTAGVDVQRDRLECEVVAWGRDKISWSLDYAVLSGDSSQPDVWEQLNKILSKDWQHASGASLPIQVMCVDSGFLTQTVYSWVRQHPQALYGGNGARVPAPRTVAAIKGRDLETALIPRVTRVSLESKRKSLKLWHVSVSMVKTELYHWLKLPSLTAETIAKGKKELPGTCHFPEYAEEYFKQLTAERRIIRMHKGFPKASWEKDPTRNNEVLDCRVYARAGAAIYGLDRFKENDWRRLEEALDVSANTPQEVSTTASNQVPKKHELSDFAKALIKQRPAIPFAMPNPHND